MSFQNAIALSEKRMLSVKEHHRQISHNVIDNSFFDEHFVSKVYLPYSQLLLKEIQKIVVDSYTNNDGVPLVTNTDILLVLENDLTKATAFVSDQGKGSVKITITLGLLLIIDVITIYTCHQKTQELETNKINKAKDFHKHFSEQFKIALDNLFAGNFNELSCSIFDAIVGLVDIVDIKEISFQSTLSILWVISHELGHFLCGHIGYYANLGVKEFGEELSSTLDIEQSVNEASKKSKTFSPIDVRRASEIAADMYANFRISILLSREIRKGHFPDMNHLDYMKAVSFAAFIPLTGFLISEHQDLKSSEILIEHKPSLYPQLSARIINVVFSLNFFFNPMDPPYRKDHIVKESDFLYSYYGFNEKDMSVMLVSVCLCLESFIERSKSLNIFDLTNVSVITFRWELCLSMLVSRMGLVGIGIDCLRQTLNGADIRQGMALWSISLLDAQEIQREKFTTHQKDTWRFKKRDSPLVEPILEYNGTTGVFETLHLDGFEYDPAFYLVEQWNRNIDFSFNHNLKNVTKFRDEEATKGAKHLMLIYEQIVESLSGKYSMHLSNS